MENSPDMREEIVCWCGNKNLKAYSPDYKRCDQCGTLVCACEVDPDSVAVKDDEKDFYGKDYWLTHLPQDYHYQDFFSRARYDLSERAVYWLRSTLNYCLPPASCLELGSGHGGFVALLQHAGFSAFGLELSPWIVAYSREAFDVHTFLGPVEEQDIEPESLDVILMLDVLEHFADPVKTIKHCVTLLKPDGKFVIQTPNYDPSKDFTTLQKTEDIFLEQFKPVEHVHLFSQISVAKLFENLGVNHIEFFDPYFPYDMFFVASPAPLIRNTTDQIEEALLATPNGRITLALLDLDTKRSETRNQLAEAEDDRKKRLDSIRELEKLLSESEADRTARLKTINKLQAQIEEIEADRLARLNNIQTLEKLLADSEADREERLANLQSLEKLLRESESDRKARLETIQELERLLRESESDRAARLENIHNLEKLLQESEFDRAAKQESIQLLESKIVEQDAELSNHLEAIHDLNGQLDQRLNQIQNLRYQLAVHEEELSRFPIRFILRFQNKLITVFSYFGDRIKARIKQNRPKRLNRIVVDLTPIIPGGGNGGAKLLATTLVWEFSRHVAPGCEYILLTSDDAHDELAWLDADNVQRMCVNNRLGQPTETESDPPEKTENDESQVSTKQLQGNQSLGKRIRRKIGQFLERWLPGPVYSRIYRFYRFEVRKPGLGNLISSLDADLVFCPFTAPFYHASGVPTVIVVHDLQFLSYPQFFSSEDIYHTNLYFQQSCQVADRLICVSDYTRKRVLEESEIDNRRVKTIHTSLYNPLERLSKQDYTQILNQFDLIPGQYLLYPANFWIHKNHEMLLTAFNIYRDQQPQSKLKLVFTGAPGDRMEFLQDAAKKMGMDEDVIFAGFVDENTLSAFFQGCLAMIFPSLYEGFGVPVLEAMHFGVPVLSSNLTSLPEVGLDAIHYFDPRKPDQIVQAIEKVETDNPYRSELIRAGKQRASEFMEPTQWAEEYFKVFQDILSEDRQYSNQITGVFSDHWVGDALEITVSAGSNNRFLELDLSVPGWLPKEMLAIDVIVDGKKQLDFDLLRGTPHRVRIPLGAQGCKIELLMAPASQPSELGIGDDTRFLSCQIQSCQLLTPNSLITLYEVNA